MKVGWLYPHREKCGITTYSQDYSAAIDSLLVIMPLDPIRWLYDRRPFLADINSCDLLHIQYDTSAFMFHDHDFYLPLLRAVKIPIVVTLHEVYQTDFGVFPRTAIKGPLKWLKLIKYDIRHPVQTAANRHYAKSFCSHKILVHHEFHRTILLSRGIPAGIIRVLPHPVKISTAPHRFTFSKKPYLALSALGFINPTYNFDLLFAVLEQCPLSWTFTWIGGIRSPDHKPLYENIKKRIAANGWQQRFHITNWVSCEQQEYFLKTVDFVLAFFLSRSSSGSIARAMGAYKPILATPHPLINELVTSGMHHFINNRAFSPLLVTPPDPVAINKTLADVQNCNTRQKNLFMGLHTYVQATNYPQMALRLIDVYREFGIL